VEALVTAFARAARSSRLDLRIVAIAPFVLWTGWCILQGERRWEQMALLVLAPLLAYGRPWMRRLFVGIYPMGLLGLVYDAMRFVKNAGITPARVHVCDLRALDARLFGVTADGARESLPEWFQSHHATVLDLICAVPYGAFLFITVGFAVFLYRKDYETMRRFAWSFLVVNIAGFLTYHVYPAAPPWYFETHGCAVDLLSRASAGPNLTRVDELLGVPFFTGLYGRSNDIFGAVPSLHVAYPTEIILFGWPHLRRVGRALSLLFFVTMAFAAIYLDHHWVIDVVVGLVYAVATYALVQSAFAWIQGSWASRPRAREPSAPGCTGE
jgi:hypothetical protein